MTDRSLRDELAGIAAQAQAVDLHERALARSRQIGRRRSLVSSVFVACAVVLVIIVGLQLRPGGDSAPVPPATPTATPTSPTDPFALLGEAVLTVPAWPKGADVGLCVSGSVPLSGGRFTARTLAGDTDVVLVQAMRARLGGGVAYLAVVECRRAEEIITSVAMAYLQASDGSFALLGKVVDSTGDQTVRLAPTAMPAVDQVALVISQFPMVGGQPQPEFSAITQTRTYTWDGTRFHQTGGTTDFYVDPGGHQIELEPGRLRLSAGSPEGCPTWVMTVAIRYTGPAPARDVAVAVIHPQLLAPRADCTPPGTQGFKSSLVPVADLRPGDEKVIEVTVIGELPMGADIQSDPSGYVAYAQPRMGDQLWFGTYPVIVENS